MASYYNDTIRDLEDIRSTLKHGDPDAINLSGIRDRLGPIISDLTILASLRRPDSLKLERKTDDQILVVVEMLVDEDTAYDMMEKLWASGG